MPRDLLVSVLDMLAAIERAGRLVEGLTEVEFLDNERAQWAVFSQIVILGEAANRIDPGFRRFHQGIPWSHAIGMRHRLIHGYDNVDWRRVWRTLQDDFPPLMESLRRISSGGHEIA